MKNFCLKLGTFLMFVAASAVADDFLPTLKVGGEVYSNVNVTTVTATDIYFNHARGMGNAKLKNLSTELQKQFHYNATNRSAIERQQAEATARFYQYVATNKPAAISAGSSGEVDSPVEYDNGDPVVKKLYAKSFRGQRPPQIIFEEWLTPPPDFEGKFVLVIFWRITDCEPCLQNIPRLNEFQSKFKDRLLVIGLGDESIEEMRKRTTPANFHIGTDPQLRTRSAVEVRGIPHAMLMDPKGNVRFEGQPSYLEASDLETLIAKYSN